MLYRLLTFGCASEIIEAEKINGINGEIAQLPIKWKLACLYKVLFIEIQIGKRSGKILVITKLDESSNAYEAAMPLVKSTTLRKL